MVVQTEGFQACFVNTQQKPISQRHICYGVSTSVEDWVTYYHLYEVVEQKFPHPEAPEDVFIFLITTVPVKTVRESDASELILLKSIQDTVKKLNSPIPSH